jgi:protocatechuate 3,4-dioxygenase alpha subunit
MTDLTATPGQTIGPFFAYALPYAGDSELVPPGRADAVRLHGRVLDGDGQPVPDALLELWQTDAAGHVVQQPGSLHRDGWTFTGWGRAATDDDGHYSFTTVRTDAPFLALTVFARGLLNRLFTRVYLPGHEEDPVLSGLGDRASTLVAEQDETGLVFDVHLQGDRETVFLTYPRHA